MPMFPSQYAPEYVRTLAGLLGFSVNVCRRADDEEEQGSSRRYYLLGEKVAIFFWYDERYGQKDKYEFSSQVPQADREFMSTYQSINVSRTKTPEQAAKDIKRRLLTSDYVKAYDESLQRMADDAKAKANKETTCQLLIKHGARASSYGDRLPSFHYEAFTPVRVNVEYMTHDGSRTALKVDDLCPEKLDKLLTFLKTI